MLGSKTAASSKVHSLVLVLAFLFVPLSILCVQILISREFDEARAMRATAEHTVATRDRLSELLTLHLDAETGVRGYVITQNPDFLGPYLRAIPKRDQAFSALRLRADRQRLAQLDRLLAVSDRKLSLAERNVEDVRAGNASVAQARIAQGEGRATMDEIRAMISAMDAEETAHLADQTRFAAQSRDQVQHAVTLLLLGVAFVLALVTIFISISIRQRRQALESSRHLAMRQRAMFDGAVDGMLWLDGSGHILRMNPSISRMFGYSEQEMLGQHNLVLMEHDYTPQESQGWLATVGIAGADGAGRRQEFTGKRADGSTFETEVAISRVETESDDPTAPRFVASIRDISGRKRAERMKTEFVSTVSHELRTPLTSIGGSLGLVMGGAAGPLEDKARRLIGIAHSNCERLIRLINDILDIEKIESGKMEFDLRRMQIGPLVRRTREAMTGFAEQHGVTIKTMVPPWPQCVMGDPDRLEQLVTNLLSNAIKHSREGGVVEVECTQHLGMARIAICDRGAGIPLDFRDRIFGKFAMADASDSRAKGGTGLGLSIVREIAQRHGGAVGFSDREGGGTIFHVDIPLAKEQRISEREADQDLPAVLHLDDDADCLSVVASSLSGKTRVIPATTLRDARFILSTEPIRAVVIDIGLGDESGLGLVDEIRGTRPNMPIVLFTAFDNTRDTQGADRLLVKSRASIEDLAQTVMALLARREREAA